MNRFSIRMNKPRNVFKEFRRVVALLAMLTATFAVAQESPQQMGSPNGGVNGGVSLESSGGGGRRVAGAGAASQWGVKLSPPSGGASTWGITRNTFPSSRFVPGAAGAHPEASVQDHPVSARAVSSKREVHSGGGWVGGAVASNSGAATGGTPQFRFSGGSHGAGSYGGGGRKASARLIAQQIKGHSTASHHSGGRRHRPKPRHQDAEPVAPKGEQECDKASKLELCTWL